MGFKKWAFKDIASTFLNLEEFGETHLINGKPMTVIIDSNEVEERGKKQFEHSRIDGIYEDNIILYVSRKNIGKQTARGQAIKIDAKEFRVTDSRDEGGVYSITMRAFKS